MLGGGWERTTGGAAWAIAGFIDVPWDGANRPHTMEIDLYNIDNEPEQPVVVRTPIGEQTFKISLQFEVGRPPGLPRGIPLRVPIGITLPPLPVGNGRYRLHVTIDGERTPDADMIFAVLPTINPQPSR